MKCKVGDRIKIIKIITTDPPSKVDKIDMEHEGREATVMDINPNAYLRSDGEYDGQYFIQFDNGERFNLLEDDTFVVIKNSSFEF